MKNLNKIVILLSLFSTMLSCKDDFEHPIDDIVVSSGEANFSTYIALGNSLTSGYRDNALYKSGQENSFPNILAGLMKSAGGGEFKVPYMPNDTGGFVGMAGFPGKLVLQLINGSLTPVATEATENSDNISATGPYQNMGVPGAKSYHLGIKGYARLNPYFSRFATSTTTSVLDDAVNQKPTFFSLWIGNNDVLSYATSGGTGVNREGDKNWQNYGSNDISDPDLVKEKIDAVLKSLTSSENQPKGVIANIPDVTSIPYFTTVPYNAITGLTEAQTTALNSAYEKYNIGLAQVRKAGLITETEYQQRIINSFTSGATQNAIVIVDKDLTDLSTIGLNSYRQATENDLVTITALALLKQGYGTQIPMPDQYILTEKENIKVQTAVTKYNVAIADLASKYDLALVDAFTEMKKLSSASGVKYYGQTYTAKFISGGAFSLDGVHLTGNGYAIIANMFVNAINQKYQSTLRNVYPGNYPGIEIP